MDQEYQELHRQFVSNHTGSSPKEILVAGLPTHLSLLLVCFLSQKFGLDYESPLGSLLEAALVCLPSLLALTVLADRPAYVNVPLAVMAISMFIWSQLNKKYTKGDMRRLWDVTVSQVYRAPFVTNYRSSMMLITSICILAVDFPVFPRRFAKTETYGYGLMDLGVGSFIFAAGMVAPERRGQPIGKSLLTCLPLLLLGLARLAAVTATGYHEHETEYGSHWNFFFTLVAVKLLSCLLVPVIPIKFAWISSVIMAVLYEGFLTFWLEEWILSDAPRDCLISANREGLCSSLGYLAIYFAGLAWGNQLLGEQFSWSSLMYETRLLLVWVFFMWCSLWYSATLFRPPSRRLANYTFFTWTVGYNLTLLAMFLICDLTVIASSEARLLPGSLINDKPSRSKERPKKRDQNYKKFPKAATSSQTKNNCESSSELKVYRCPKLYSALSYNSLAIFLFANLTTGCVNFLFRTIEIDGCPAVLLLCAYLATLALVASLLHTYKIKLKFW